MTHSHRFALDKSSIAERSLHRDFARSAMGTRTKRVPRSRRGKRYLLLPAIFTGGVLAMACQEGGFKRKDFEFYLEHQLVSTAVICFGLARCEEGS